MLRLKRADPDMRIELMPLIDVIFLILTFFVYAMVMMVRVDVLPVPMESYGSGSSAESAPAVAITQRVDGTIHVGQEETGLEHMLDAVSRAQAKDPDGRVPGAGRGARHHRSRAAAHGRMGPAASGRYRHQTGG